MNKRYQSIGIGQNIRLEWMQHVVGLIKDNSIGNSDIRKELTNFLRYRKSENSNSERGARTAGMTASILANTWVNPEPELVALRDDWLAFIKNNSNMEIAAHWGMISAAYPFWFNTAHQIGRLFALQNSIRPSQIVQRLKEQYGDRETVSRCTRYTVRSMVLWKVINDSAKKGQYIKPQATININEKGMALLVESALHTIPGGKSPLKLLTSHPALFPFSKPYISGEAIVAQNPRIELMRHGMNDELLQFRHTY